MVSGWLLWISRLGLQSVLTGAFCAAARASQTAAGQIQVAHLRFVSMMAGVAFAFHFVERSDENR